MSFEKIKDFDQIEDIDQKEVLKVIIQFIFSNCAIIVRHNGFIYYVDRTDKFKSERLLIVEINEIQQLHESWKRPGYIAASPSCKIIPGKEYFKFNGRFKVLALNPQIYEDNKVIIAPSDFEEHDRIIAYQGGNYYLVPLYLETARDFLITPIKNNFKFAKIVDDWSISKCKKYAFAASGTYYIADPYNGRSFLSATHVPELINPETGAKTTLYPLTVVMKSYSGIKDYINQMEGRELITEIPYDACILYYDPHWNVYHIDMSMGGTQILRFKGAGKITKAAAAAVND